MSDEVGRRRALQEEAKGRRALQEEEQCALESTVVETTITTDSADDAQVVSDALSDTIQQSAQTETFGGIPLCDTPGEPTTTPEVLPAPSPPPPTPPPLSCSLSQTLLASDGEADDKFGLAVDLSGNTVVVGAGWDDVKEGGDDQGSAYLFEASSGGELRKLTADDGELGQYFGENSVAIRGDTVVVSADADRAGTENAYTGAAYVYDATSGNLLTKLVAADGEEEDYFGVAVAISDSDEQSYTYEGVSSGNIVVGAYTAAPSGKAYVFDSSGSFDERFRLTPPSGINAFSLFGKALAISGKLIVVGAFRDNVNEEEFSGSAYLYDARTGNLLRQLTPSDPKAGTWFGFAVAISGNTVVVGACKGEDDGSRANTDKVYVFDARSGEQLLKLTPSDGDAKRFGCAVAISGRTIVVGAFKDDDNGAESGSAYVFDAVSGEELQKLTPSDGATKDYFGYSVAIEGSTIVVGAPQPESSRTGKAFVFTC